MATLMLALASVFLLVVAPVFDLYSERETTLEQQRSLAPRLAAAGRELPALRARAAELRSAASAAQITLDGASDAIASANLQSRTEELAAAAGATIGSTEALAAEDRSGYRKIGLRIAVNGDYEAVVKLLAAIEEGTPPLVLGNLQIRGTAAPAGQAPRPRLDASFEVFGFRSADASPTVKQ